MPAEIAAVYEATLRQVALALLVNHAFVILKASPPEHTVENAGAGDIKLSEAEGVPIDVAFPLVPRTAGLPMI